MKVAGFGAHDAKITFRQRPKAGKTVTLIEAFFGYATAGNTQNAPAESQCHHFTH
jgi:hypothetical protein